MPLIHSATTKLQVWLHKDAAAAGWGAERKTQATYVVSSPWMRYHCDIVEGKSKKPDSRFAEQIDYHLHAFAKTNWRRQAKRHADKAFAITARAMALGHIQDLTDPKTSTQWVRIWVLAYTIGYAAGKIMMGPDLELSNFGHVDEETGEWVNELSIVYYAPGYELNIKGFQDSYALICDLWGGPVIIEPYPGLPQAIWIRPVQIESTAIEFGGEDGEDLPQLDVLSFGHSLKNARKKITFDLRTMENPKNMLVIGMTGSGKSVFVQNTCWQLTRMKDQVEGISYIDGAYSAGLGSLRDLGIRVADSAETVAAEVHYIQELANQRDAIMKEKDWPKWRGKLYVVVIDENHQFFAQHPPSSVIGGIVKNFPTVLRKRGIMIISVGPNFTDKEGPGVYYGAFEWKVLFRVEEPVIVNRMFHKEKTTFDFHPLTMTMGQCCMTLPGQMELEYVMCHQPMLKGGD